MKNCPFCGSRARVQSYDSWRGAWARIMCSNKGCGARGPTVRRFVVAEPKRAGDVTREELKQWAARSWDSRIGDP